MSARNGWHLPWEGAQVPHALLDITRRCTITCRSCYNTEDGEDKPLAEVKAEVGKLLALRRLTSISIVGGEPTLHPDLPEIVRFIRSLGLHAELFTNGVALDSPLAAKLAAAGLEVAFLHIQGGQERPDLPHGATPSDRERLLAEKVRLLSGHGIEAGLSITAYRDFPEEVAWAVERTVCTPALNYLLVTLDRDVRSLPELVGDIGTGIRCREGTPAACGGKRCELAPLTEALQQARGWQPFCYLGSNLDRSDPRWVSFVTFCAYRGGALTRELSLRSSLLERLYLRLELALKGRYPFFARQRRWILKVQLLLNAFLGGDAPGNLAFLARTAGGADEMVMKKVLFQSLAYVGADGRVVHCAHCPDAVVQHGRLVPACIGDRVRCGP